MIEQINISELELVSNYILIKVDPDYDFVELKGPNGTTVALQVIDFTMKGPDTKAISITGTVLNTPERLLFHRELKIHEKGKTIAGDEFEALMRQSLTHDTDLNVSAGNKVIFDYKVGVDAETEGRLLKDENGEFCVLIRYENLFAKEVDGEIIPLNGWVFFIRDQRAEEIRESGIILPGATDKYEKNIGVVISSDKPLRAYLDKGVQDSREELPAGTKIALQRKFGFRIAYDTHAGELKGFEAIRRRNILATFEE